MAFVAFAALVFAVFSLSYVALSVVVTFGWRRHAPRVAEPQPLPPVSVLKPLCGLEPGLYENLRSFCEQSHTNYELLFGARDPNDPALAVARRVAAEYPHLDIRIISGAARLGENRKINTLINLMPHARYDMIVIVDSDILVGPNYLERVVQPLTDPKVGIVSCTYRGRPAGGVWSELGALAIDEWFIPSVLVSGTLGSNAYCSGTTMALRRDVLNAVGGLDVLAPLLADDYELGLRVRQLGLSCVIPRYELVATEHEPTLLDLVRHELRWMRTIRTVTPLGHALSLLTYVVPLTLLASAAFSFARWSLILPALAVLLRVALHYVVGRPAVWDVDRIAIDEPRPWYLVWLVPIRDIMSFAMWVMSYMSRRVTWRGTELWVRPDGVLRTRHEGSYA
jgi:ceramide glucosyltransferase